MGVPKIKIFVGIILLAVVVGEISAGADSGHTVRVMVRKEFKLQPDGSYKEISSTLEDKKKVVDSSPVEKDLRESSDHHDDDFADESAPPAMYAYSPQQQPYQYYQSGGDYETQGSAQYLQFTADDVQDVMRQFEEMERNKLVQHHHQYQQPQSSSSRNYVTYIKSNFSGSASAHPSYPTYEQLKPTPSQAYYLDHNPASNNIRSNFGAPKSIQEILKNKPEQKRQKQPAAAADTQNSHYYSPKENEYNYGSTGGGGDYNSYDNGISNQYGSNGGDGGSGGDFSQSYGAPNPGVGFIPTPIPDYGAPAAGPVSDHHNPHNQWSASYGGELNQGGGGGYNSGSDGGGGGVISSLVKTVATVGQTKAHVTGQILTQGGKVVQQAVVQKGEKAKIIANTFSGVPARFSEVLRSKAHAATRFLDSGSRTVGSVLHVKAQVVNQASNIIAAKGKAANAVIRASGGTAANLIVAKGKGIANLISTGGAATAALLNHKGNKVLRVAEVLGGLRGGGSGGGWSSDDGGGGGLVGGYSENEDQYETYVSPSPSQVYDERKLQDALKSVVQSPASSYGSPPSSSAVDTNNNAASENEVGGGQAKLTSAFQSIYNTFKSVQPQQSSLFGSYSSSSEVTAKPEHNEHQNQPSLGQSASSIGESLNKMSKMLNNVASAINWLQPKKE